ncbi:alpha-amylase family protein [Sinorhizobium numidicum]|uniref:Alpha-amylase family protein n=1 Tax=Sinorhizobium numidicum TaxID=680248 RepID=A0ABY8CNK7_9HYPH|nr:alpha-amylase family protein [Sinorhizobium numidicum]WEX74268.1 alpha-amylase family protein [Sinorhizobium numidicum]WEX80253.1 alpha-amylase family protein [Sinorhizobium numidicum]
MEEVPWFAGAVIYGIDVKRFADGNGDGIGDFTGLTSRVTYLHDLGINCIWLSPFFKSPFADNGYDISDYYSVDPRVGTLEDFLGFLHAAGEQGIRVIIDLAVNHTSTKHPWFEAAKRDPKCRFRDYYVWSEHPPPVEADNETAFPGEENSVWTYDEIAQAYYFHKFRHFQPDLNTANPAVLQEILAVVDYWLALNVDGFRVDAAPFVIGETGIEHANPRDPHGFLREIRELLNARRPDALLLGEVDLAPDALRDYFGESKLDLLLNFILSGALFGALAQREANVIHEALALLPEPPPRCGWANFLRNLDELNLARLPADIQERIYAEFAPKESMRIYGRGIRRRLAPLLEGDQKRIALALSLLLSAPGVPLLLYGDEIGIGDDLSLPGREAVRVLMQWNEGKNGGFSNAASNELLQRPISTGAFSFKRVNVADQLKDPTSLLNHARQLIFARRRHDIFYKGRLLPLRADHPALFASAYSRGTELLVAVHNLADEAIEASLDLPGRFDSDFACIVGECGVVVCDRQLAVTLGPYGHAWLYTALES